MVGARKLDAPVLTEHLEALKLIVTECLQIGSGVIIELLENSPHR